MATEEQNLNLTSRAAVRRRRAGLTARLFGCKHRQLGLPRSNGSEAYRECVNCGARRNFNPETWQTIGPFYFLDQSA
jgi:hypothetical protein